VVGFAGNHDTFGTPSDIDRFHAERGVHLLNGETTLFDELLVAGIGGVIGRPERENRHSAEEFGRMALALLEAEPQVLMLHEGPDDPETGRVGNPHVRASLTGHTKTLVVCGHCYWAEPLTELRGGPQVLNVDSRVVLLRPRDKVNRRAIADALTAEGQALGLEY
jgi:3',5'-cyclic-AMP phosphodiesterase